MVQKNNLPLSRKRTQNFRSLNLAERHLSGIRAGHERHMSNAAHVSAQADFTQPNLTRLYFVTGHVGCLEKVARPEPFCAFLQNSP
jgi:hypothetical protein